MTRSAYYEQMKALARQVRTDFTLEGPRVSISDLRKVYKEHGVRIDLRPGFRELRGAYFNDEDGVSVVINKELPEDPRVFTMGHELKHHLVDRETAGFQCSFREDTSDVVEIGAEVFAAELLLPEKLFEELLASAGVRKGHCCPEDLVTLKRHTRTTLSYAGLVKRAEFLGYISRGSMAGVRFKKLEEKLFGKPFRRRRRK